MTSKSFNTVRAHCASCNQNVEVGAAEVIIVGASGLPIAEYFLNCPSCSRVIRGPIRPRTAMVLATSGAQLFDAAEAISEDEIERFVTALEDVDAVGRALQAIRR